MGARDVGGRIASEDVADVEPDARRRGAPDHRLDPGAHVLDVEVLADERDHVGRVLHEIAEVGAPFLDAYGRILGGLRGCTKRSHDEREEHGGRAGDGV